MIKNIWTNTEDIIDARLKEMYPEIFDDGDVKEFYIPGNKPNEISLKKWEKLVKENPLLENTDLPFAVSKQGEIVCIEKIKTAIKIGLVGETQTGKSTALYSMADIMRWWWRFKIGFMNEGLSICYDHLHKNRVPVFAKKHKLLGMQPMGLPLVFCYPSVEDLELPGIKPELKITVPFKEFLKDPRLFCDLGKSSKHLAKLKPELKGLESFEEIDVKIEESDMPGNSKKALSSAINELSEAKLFDLNNNPHSNLIVKRMEKLTVKEDYDLNPLVALMKADLIPCLMTSKLAGNKYEEKVFNFYLKAIWHSKEKGGPLRDSPIALFIDELNQVQGNNREILIKMVREGANMGAGGISMMWCAQNYLLIDQVIRNNTTIGFIFRQTGEDATAIGKRYCLNKYWVDRIPQLQKFECLLVTKDRFKLYNPSTGKVYYSEEPILAEILPPLSLHRKELSLDDYAVPIKPHYLHERVLKANRHFIFDNAGNGLFTKRTFSAFANGSAINESVELTRKRLNVHPITIYEEDDLKSEYFKGNLQKNEDISYQDLQRMGLRIISMPSKMIIGEDTQIRVMYAFWPITLPIPEDAMILQSCPHVTIIFNNDKNAVRMYSTNCGSFKTKKLTGTSDWFYLEKLKKL